MRNIAESLCTHIYYEREIKKEEKKSRIKLLHQYYSYTGFYNFLGSSIKKAIMPILVIIAILLLVHFFVIDLGEALKSLTQELPPYGILLVFFLSESLLGLIPPEIFIAWANTTLHPNGNLALLATLSYMGGILSYFIGKAITDIPAVHNYLEVKMAKHLKNTAKMGRIFNSSWSFTSDTIFNNMCSRWYYRISP